jgi:hypothetical protein
VLPFVDLSVKDVRKLPADNPVLLIIEFLLNKKDCKSIDKLAVFDNTTNRNI